MKTQMWRELLLRWLTLQKRDNGSAGGFSLLEILIAIAIAVTFAALAARPLFRSLNSARGNEAVTQILNIGKTQEGFYSRLDGGFFASDFQSLQGLAPGEKSALQASSSYTYEMSLVGSGPNQYVLITGTPKKPAFPTAAGRVFLQGGSPYSVACKGNPGQALNVSNVITVDDCPKETTTP